MSDLCPIAVAQDSFEDDYQPETASESHLLLLKQKKYCDVTFTFPNLPDRIEAHEFCLKARSPVFAKIFRMRKSGNVRSNEIEVSESTPEIFQKFLEFIYADKFEVDIAGAVDLIQLAQKFKVHPLTKKCEELLKTEIPIVDSVKVFQIARRYGRQELMDRAGSVMVESFIKLARADSLANADEETLVYLLECDDLAVKEVGLFQFILDWGRNQVENSADGGLLENKLKNLTSKIRYTNMAPEEFTKVVVPTGLLSPEESLSIYTFICGDEVPRRDFSSKFNTTPRKIEDTKAVTKIVDFSTYGWALYQKWLPAFRTHSLSFTADRTQVDGKALRDYSLRKTVITAIPISCPHVNLEYRENHVLNFIVSVVEYSGPTKEGNFTLRFQKKLLNCRHGEMDEVSVEPPVELVPGRMYSVIVEDNSTSDSVLSFRKHPLAYFGDCLLNSNTHGNVDLEDVSLTLKDIHWKTDNYAQEACDESKELALIRKITIRQT